MSETIKRSDIIESSCSCRNSSLNPVEMTYLFLFFAASIDTTTILVFSGPLLHSSVRVLLNVVDGGVLFVS